METLRFIAHDAHGMFLSFCEHSRQPRTKNREPMRTLSVTESLDSEKRRVSDRNKMLTKSEPVFHMF